METKSFFKNHIGDRINFNYFGHDLTGVIYDAEVGERLGFYVRTDEPININGRTENEFRIEGDQIKNAVVV